MKKNLLPIIISIIFLLLVQSINSQSIECDWTNSDITGASGILKVAVSDNDSYYSGGSYEYVFLDNTQLTSTGSKSGLLIKNNALGNIDWYKTFDAGDKCIVESIAADNDGNVFAAMEFHGSLTVNSNQYTNNKSPNYNNDILLTKYDELGNVKFVKHFSGLSSIEFSSIQTDNNGNVIIVCNSVGTIKVNNTQVNNTTLYSIFKFNKDGLLLWHKNLPSGFAMFGRETMTIDNENSIIIAGNYHSNVNWGSNVVTASSQNGGFIGKLDSLGNELWANKIASSYVQSERVTADDNGNIYIVGRSQGIVIFNNSTAVNFVENSYFLSSYDSFGVFKKHQIFDHQGDIRSISIKDESLLLVGNVNWPNPIVYLFNPNLELLKSATFKGYCAQSIEQDNSGNILLGGSFKDSLEIGSCITIKSSASYGETYYTSKFKFVENTTAINESTVEEFEIYPNPSSNYLNIELSKSSHNSIITIYNSNGSLVRNQSLKTSTERINITELESGIYFLMLTNEKGIISKKFIKM